MGHNRPHKAHNGHLERLTVARAAQAANALAVWLCSVDIMRQDDGTTAAGT